ncbi:MAG TPA: hypothetical protein VGT41_06815 [Candidatus Babeliales bacterium]|nr:hypothetical protein [Candidatus Babeliales bacterium]
MNIINALIVCQCMVAAVDACRMKPKFPSHFFLGAGKIQLEQGMHIRYCFWHVDFATLQ